jgi:hypothetical protein
MSALIERGKFKLKWGVSSPGQAFGLTFLLMIELITGNVVRGTGAVGIDIA